VAVIVRFFKGFSASRALYRSPRVHLAMLALGLLTSSTIFDSALMVEYLGCTPLTQKGIRPQ
jgi:hypothetical protein